MHDTLEYDPDGKVFFRKGTLTTSNYYDVLKDIHPIQEDDPYRYVFANRAEFCRDSNVSENETLGEEESEQLNPSQSYKYEIQRTITRPALSWGVFAALCAGSTSFLGPYHFFSNFFGNSIGAGAGVLSWLSYSAVKFDAILIARLGKSNAWQNTIIILSVLSALTSGILAYDSIDSLMQLFDSKNDFLNLAVSLFLSVASFVYTIPLNMISMQELPPTFKKITRKVRDFKKRYRNFSHLINTFFAISLVLLIIMPCCSVAGRVNRTQDFFFGLFLKAARTDSDSLPALMTSYGLGVITQIPTWFITAVSLLKGFFRIKDYLMALGQGQAQPILIFVALIAAIIATPMAINYPTLTYEAVLNWMGQKDFAQGAAWLAGGLGAVPTYLLGTCNVIDYIFPSLRAGGEYFLSAVKSGGNRISSIIPCLQSNTVNP